MQSPAPQQPPVRQRILPQVFIPTAASVLALLAFSIAAPRTGHPLVHSGQDLGGQ